ncbi:MAG: GNAT family N-acetyltransferase [Candidatus Lokiarchaeota archaeon]|nr:GNAT family N-acetyltransferase [Candidatus Lokiarchaeota archaeon]
MSELYHLKQLQEDQIEAASKVVGRAFQDDPLFVYCFPDPIERKIKSVTHCECMILLGILSGEVYTTSSEIEGVAVWHPYAIEDKKMGKQSKEITRRLRKVKREEFSDPLIIERMSIVEEIANSFQNQHVNFPHWYLSIFGVDPIHQSKGYGSKLLRMKLAEIDKKNLPCYLHTENGKNIQIYEHFGFELVGKAKVPNSNFYYHGMLRNKKKEY